MLSVTYSGALTILSHSDTRGAIPALLVPYFPRLVQCLFLVVYPFPGTSKMRFMELYWFDLRMTRAKHCHNQHCHPHTRRMHRPDRQRWDIGQKKMLSDGGRLDAARSAL